MILNERAGKELAQEHTMQNVALDALDGSEFGRLVRGHFEEPNTNVDGQLQGDHMLNKHIENNVVKKALKPAAVLIPIVERDNGLQVIFTKRTEKLRSHSGQVSFPGGKIDDGDLDGKAAALRETHEEIGVDASAIDVLGQFPNYHSGSGYVITPVVGLIESTAKFIANEDEVETIFEVPLAFLMNPDNHEIHNREFDKINWQYYQMVWGEHRIWGVTAGMVRMFYNRIFK